MIDSIKTWKYLSFAMIGILAVWAIATIPTQATAAPTGASGPKAATDVACEGCVGSNGDGTNDIANGAVTNAKVGDGAVNSAKILDGSVATADLANGAVTSSKIESGAVNLNIVARLGSSNEIPANDYGFASAFCNSGEVAVGAGYLQLVSYPSIEVIRSYHESVSNGWTMDVYNPSSTAKTFTVEVLCAAISP